MYKEIKFGIAAFLLMSSLTLIFQQFAFGFDENSMAILQIKDQPIQNVTFMLLAIEQNSNQAHLRSAQRLIKTLLFFNNWRNGTISAGFQYFTDVHLLSNVLFRDIDPDCRTYYKGNVTRVNVMREISMLLNQTTINAGKSSFHVLILYFIGETNRAVTNGATSYYMALDEPLYDWELNQTLQLRANNSSVLIALDTCYGGGYLSKLNQPGRVVLAACNPNEEANVWASSENPELEYEGWFTGHQNAPFSNQTFFGPLGLIGGVLNATDVNKDGWRSANEIFRFASQTTTWYAANQTDLEIQAPYSQHPWASYCIAGGEIPVIHYEESKPFPGKAKDCPPQSILPGQSRYDCSEFEHRMYRQSLSRTGFASTEGPEKPDVLWVSLLNESVIATPAVAEGMVFVGTLGGRFYALDMSTGEIFWMFKTDSPISSSPAVVDGIVFFGTEEPGKVYALDSYTGLVNWVYEVPSGGAIYSSPAIFLDMVFFGCSDRYLYCLSKYEGSLLWSTYVGGEKLSSPAIEGNMIFITNPHVYAVDVFTAKLIWEYETDWAVISSPAVADGLVFVGSQNDDRVYALEQNSGKLVWSFRTGGWFTSPAIDSSKKLVILGCRDARIYCLDEFSGIAKWYYIDGVNYLSAPTISANGLVYAGSSDGDFYCIDEETGEKVWDYTVSAPIVSSPSVIYGHVYVGSTDGRIHCFGPPFPNHDVAVLNIGWPNVKLKMNDSLGINYLLMNYGNADENVTVSCGLNRSSVWTAPEYLEPIIIHSEIVPIASGNHFLHTYSWNTTGEVPGSYSISVQADLVPDETDTSDNVFIVNAMIIAPSDLDANGEINIMDVSMVARAYGTTPEMPNWNQNADINKDSIINILDVALVAQDFGEIYA